MPSTGRSRWLVAGALLWAAAGLAVSLAFFPIGDLDVESDFYAELGPAAQAIAAGQWHVANHPYKGPLQPVLTAAAHAALGPLGVGWYRSAVLVSLASGVVTLLATYRLARDLAGGRVAAATAVLTAAAHLVFVASHKAASDGPFLAFATAAVATTLAAGPARDRRWVAAGLLAGAAFLTRYAGAVAPLWCAGVAWFGPTAAGAARPSRARNVALVAAGFLVLVLPWLALNLVQTGSPLATRNAENVAREFGGLGAGEAIRHFAANVPRRLADFAATGVGVTSAVLALIGSLLALRRPANGRWVALLAWAAVSVVPLAAVFWVPRFALPLVPVAAIAIAFLLVGGAVRPLAARGHAVGWLALVAVLAVWASRSVTAVRYYHAEAPTHLAGVIAHLRERADRDPPPVLMARKAHAAFLADLPWLPYPAEAMPAAAFARAAARRGADLILAGPVERRLGAGGFDAEILGELEGLAIAHASGGNVVYDLDRTLAAERLGRDPAADALAARLDALIAAGAAREATATAERLAHRRWQAGETAAARTVLAAAVGAFGEDASVPEADRLRLRANLAWLHLQAREYEAGVAVLAGRLPRYAAHGDRALEARALDHLGRLLAGLGRGSEARDALRQAAAVYREAGLAADGAAAERALEALR